MPQAVRARKQQFVQYALNTKSSLQLSRGMIYRELYLNLTLQPTLTNANNTQANTMLGDEWGVVKKIEVIANGTDVLKSISGDDLWWLNFFLYRAPPQVQPTIGDGATANPSISSWLILPLWDPHNERPIDTCLDSRILSDLRIEITWGTFTDVNSAATAWTVQPQLNVHTREAFGISGPFTQWRLFPIAVPISAANPQLQVQLPVGKVYRAFLIKAISNGSESGAVLNNFKFQSGSTVFADQPAALINQTEVVRRGMPRGFSGGAGGTYDQLRRSTKSTINGIYFFDQVMDGMLTESIDALGFSELTLELDVLAPTAPSLIIYPMQLIPPRGVPKGK